MLAFVSRFYERKNPLLIYRIIKYMKDTNFYSSWQGVGKV